MALGHKCVQTFQCISNFNKSWTDHLSSRGVSCLNRRPSNIEGVLSIIHSRLVLGSWTGLKKQWSNLLYWSFWFSWARTLLGGKGELNTGEESTYDWLSFRVVLEKEFLKRKKKHIHHSWKIIRWAMRNNFNFSTEPAAKVYKICEINISCHNF